MPRRATVTRALFCLMLIPAPAALAQYRVPRPGTSPALGRGVDTLPTGGWAERSSGSVAAIYHRWAAFLSSSAPRYTAPFAAPSPFWSLEDQRRWNSFAPALGFVSEGAVPFVLDIRPASAGSDSVYVVKTLFQVPATGGGLLPDALVRVYAVREHANWVFSNALPRTTRGWQHRTVGPFEYVYPPAHNFDVVRAHRAGLFADSLASAFGLPKISGITYYMAGSPDEMNRIIGLDWLPTLTDVGAFNSADDHLLVSGDAAQGENYRHEIVHLVLAPLAAHGIHEVLQEGVATWLGGTLGMDPTVTHRTFAVYLRAHPDITLNSILLESRDRGFRPAGAAVCEMVYEHSGIAGLKTLFNAGRTDGALKAALEEIMNETWPEVEAAWRRAALR